jgi:hypothetical protein
LISKLRRLKNNSLKKNSRRSKRKWRKIIIISLNKGLKAKIQKRGTYMTDFVIETKKSKRRNNNKTTILFLI